MEFEGNTVEILPTLGSAYSADDVLFEPIEIRRRSLGTVEMTQTHQGFAGRIARLGVTWGVSAAPSIRLLFFDIDPSASFGTINTSPLINFEDLRNRLATIIIDDSAYASLNNLQFVDITGDSLGIFQSRRINTSVWIAGIIDADYSGDLADQLSIQIDIVVGGELGSN